MATVGDIIVVQDGKARLKKGQPISVGLSVPKNIDRDSHSVLTFMVDSVGELDGFEFHAELVSAGPGGLTEVYKATYHDAHYHGVQEVLPRGRLSFPGPTLQFAYDGGDGEIDISDIVVWIRVNV
jgi:hypothetical protein